MNDERFEVGIRLVGECEPHSLLVMSICWGKNCCFEKYKDLSVSSEFATLQPSLFFSLLFIQMELSMVLQI